MSDDGQLLIQFARAQYLNQTREVLDQSGLVKGLSVNSSAVIKAVQISQVDQIVTGSVAGVIKAPLGQAAIEGLGSALS